MKYLSLIVLTIFLATPAMAGQYKTVSVKSITVNSHNDTNKLTSGDCRPVIGNYTSTNKNGTILITCRMDSSGGLTTRSTTTFHDVRVKAPCNRNEKNS